MSYLRIVNQGEIDVNALFLLGASTKEGQDKIGFFGSGNKYAMATLLRNGIPFYIFSGEKEIAISTQEVSFGGQQFQQILVNGVTTSFTTRMGPTWKVWFALREFICNAKDEGDYGIDEAASLSPCAGTTQIFVEMTDEVRDVYEHLSLYIRTDELVEVETVSGNYGKVTALRHTDNEEYVAMRKGIRVNEENALKSIFIYDFDTLSINESRVYQYSWEITERIAQFYALTKDKENIRSLCAVLRNALYIECNASWVDGYIKRIAFSSAWNEALKGELIMRESQMAYMPAEDVCRATVLPDSLVNILEEQFPALNFANKIGENYVVVEPNEEQKNTLAKALNEISAFGYLVPCYRTTLVHFNEESVIASTDTDKKEILLSIDALNGEYEELLATLIEEYAHAKGHGDGTRDYEQYLTRELAHAKHSIISALASIGSN
jgi:hypothetical protein